MLRHLTGYVLIGEQEPLATPLDIAAGADMRCRPISESAGYRCHERLHLKAHQMRRHRQLFIERRLLLYRHSAASILLPLPH